MSATTSLAGKVAIVTGGASGMGFAIARLLVERGVRVAISDVREAALHEAAAKISADCIPLHVDNTRPADIPAALDLVLREAGRLDILINNAGVSGYSKPLAEIDADMFDVMFATHVKGAFFWTQAVTPAMRQQGGGRIVNMSSNFSLTGHPNMSHYVAAKSALLGLTKAWAREFAGDRINVNAVAPGLIATRMTRDSVGEAALQERGAQVPLGRLATPEEIAFAVAWLVSDEAAMMTGQVLSPNGGSSIVGL